ncbi:MAG: hypothetical protein INR68_08900 [Methylobacterium mesophilicum]|nr:hypothetical protein [Methylobacterium mesophilicum]
MPITFNLTNEEVQVLMTPVNGQGGFQSFFRSLQAELDAVTHTIELEDADVGRIVRHITYRPGGFENRLSDIFGRSLRQYIA